MEHKVGDKVRTHLPYTQTGLGIIIDITKSIFDGNSSAYTITLIDRNDSYVFYEDEFTNLTHEYNDKLNGYIKD